MLPTYISTYKLTRTDDDLKGRLLLDGIPANDSVRFPPIAICEKYYRSVVCPFLSHARAPCYSRQTECVGGHSAETFVWLEITWYCTILYFEIVHACVLAYPNKRMNIDWLIGPQLTYGACRFAYVRPQQVAVWCDVNCRTKCHQWCLAEQHVTVAACVGHLAPRLIE